MSIAPYHPQPAETHWLRRWLTHPAMPTVVIFAAMLAAGAWQWAHL